METLVEKKRPQNKQQLSQAIFESWNKIPIKFIRNCIDNLPKKVEAITVIHKITVPLIII